MVEHGHPTPESRSQTVLLVDDDPSMVALCRKKLEEEGFKVLQASESPEALDTCSGHSGPIHLLLTALLLPPKRRQWAAAPSKLARRHGVACMRRAAKSRANRRAL